MQPHIPLPPMAPYPQSADANLLQWMNPMMAPETFVESPEVSWHHQQQHQQHILNSQQARAGNCGKLFVGGLPATCGNEELREYFGKFGSIVDCVVMYDKENRHRGFGFCHICHCKRERSRYVRLREALHRQKMDRSEAMHSKRRHGRLPPGPTRFTENAIASQGIGGQFFGEDRCFLLGQQGD